MAHKTYVPKSERAKPTADQASFVLKELSIEDMVEIENNMAVADASGAQRLQVGTMKLHRFLRGIVSWVNVPGLAPEKFDDAAKKLLPTKWFSELVEAINALSEVSEADEGK